MKAVVFTGMPWSGKSEAVAIAGTLGLPVVRMGDFVWEEVKRRDLLLNSENVGRTASEMRKEQGKEIWAKRTVDYIKSLGSISIVIIDGARNIEEIEFFQQVFKEDFLLVAIIASDPIRHRRAMARDRTDDSKNISDIRKRDEREVSWGIEKVISSADVVIENNNSLDKFCNQMKEFLLDLQKR